MRQVWNGPLAAGEHRLTWDGRNGQGQAAAAGVYLYRLQVGDQTRLRKMVKLAGGYQHDLPALRDFIRQAFGQIGYAEHKEWSFVRLPPEHPLYHCFYDIDSLPRGFWRHLVLGLGRAL